MFNILILKNIYAILLNWRKIICKIVYIYVTLLVKKVIYDLIENAWKVIHEILNVNGDFKGLQCWGHSEGEMLKRREGIVFHFIVFRKKTFFFFFLHLRTSVWWLFSCYKATSLILNFLLFMSQYVAFQETCLGQISSATWAWALHLYSEETEEINPCLQSQL